MNTSEGNMKKSVTAESRTISPEFKIKPLDGGTHCPSKWDLFEYSDKVLSQSNLTDKEEMVAAHIEKCDMCRSIFDGAVYFGAIPLQISVESGTDMPKHHGSLLQRLRRVVGTTQKKVVPFSEYFEDMVEAANASVDDALSLFSTGERIELSDLDSQPIIAMLAASDLGIAPAVAEHWIRYSWCLRKLSCQIPYVAIHPRGAVAGGPITTEASGSLSDDQLISEFNEFVTSCRRDANINMLEIDDQIADCLNRL